MPTRHGKSRRYLGSARKERLGENFSREVKDPKVAEAATAQKEKMIADHVATLQR